MNLFDILKKPEIYKYLLVGIGGSIIVLVMTIVLTSIFEIFYVISTIIAFEISIIWGFFANDRWTFGKVKKSSKAYIRFIKYNLFSLISLGILQGIMISLVTILEWHYSHSQVIGIIVSFFFNFLASKHISFKN